MFHKSENIEKLAAALVLAQSKMENAVKDSSNPFFKSKFADLNAVREACTPALNEAKISIIQPIVQTENGEYVETTLLHESGQWLSSLTKIVCVKDKDPQSYGSAISYARRYGLQALISLGAEDDDGEKAMGRVTSSASATNTFKSQAKSTTGFGAKAAATTTTATNANKEVY